MTRFLPLAVACIGGLIADVTPAARAWNRDSTRIRVAQEGTGDFRTIQEAIDAVPAGNTRTVLILIGKGTYEEKLFITTSHLALVGEDRDSTRIIYAELRSNWVKEHDGSDWGSAVVNIGDGVTDIILANLTVHNNYPTPSRCSVQISRYSNLASSGRTF